MATKKSGVKSANAQPHAKRRLPIGQRIVRYGRRFDFTGLVFAVIAFCMSVLPSLLPRPWLYQGIISGISIAIGYGVGAFISAAVRWALSGRTIIRLSPTTTRRAWHGLAIVGIAITISYLYLGTVWQNEVRTLVGEQTVPEHYLVRTAVVMLLVAFLLLSLGRGIRRLTAFIIKLLDDYLPRRISIVLGVFAITAFLWWIVSGVFFNFFVTVSNNFYDAKNNQTPPGVSQPTSSNRSGGPGSYVPWDTIGYQGQAFVGRGPSDSQLTEFNHQPSTDPIRVYVGLNSTDNAAARAQLAVQELQRTHAFDRKVLILATATGTGWLEPQSVDSLEYMYNGDSAIVTQQYSYLPSWISFLVDKQNARDAGRALFDAVYEAWAKQPADHRPKLIAYGLSLGSFGGQAAYSGVNDMRRSLDGALFMGTPNDTELWRTITANRQPGSPEWQPIYQQGAAVRFAATNSNVTADQSTWHAPRILYMQHASDPVVWFSFSLPFHEPDWLKEPRGPDVSPRTHWYPIVTFFQVAVDQFFGTTVPNGHGHNYGNTIVSSWQAVAQPAGWTADDSTRLQKLIDSYSNE